MTHGVDPRLAQLQSPDAHERSRAALQLQPGTLNDAAAVAALVQVLCRDDDLNVVEDATWALVRFGAAAAAALIDAIAQAEARARHNIVHALGKLGDARAVPALIVTAQDVEPSVRLKSVYALGQIGDAQAIDALVARLADPAEEVRWTAREALHGFGGKSLPRLIDALAAESVHMREFSASLLGELGDERAVEPLIAAAASADWPVRLAVAEAFGSIGSVRALPVVERMADDPHPHVRAMAAAAAKALAQRKR